jgi:hypothetical protein
MFEIDFFPSFSLDCVVIGSCRERLNFLFIAVEVSPFINC